MENFETVPTTKYGIEKTNENVEGNSIQVEWTVASGEDKEGMEWQGKIVGKGSDGSVWEGEGQIYRINAEGKTVALNINDILTKKLVQKSEEL